ncbi:ATP-dependent RNA helicase DDX24 isoform X2 [Vanessa cardui]|uniref:ATP-dependent RNA helicase DDX24 isoform X2 n=1 Tax=Vanessa cardui TaxID=171605 RepID=UPI001F13A541|nr:ATP-dependent RNA helicase DDX24 isoform X2 [Vanessa cardui]
MSKKINNLKWESVAFDGFPTSMMDKGFVALEECTDYGLDKNSRRSKKAKQPEKRKNIENINPQTAKSEVPRKKIKLSNGFTVETCKNITPSTTNDAKETRKKQKKKEKKNKNKQTSQNSKENNTNSNIAVKKNKKPKLGENAPGETSDLTPVDMLSWAEFKLPEEILKALMELGFKQPTKIQQLSLPAAIHGRRDILGAAETGSGKTLAFGLPILSGIMKLKEKAALKGLDVYDIPYRKSSVKKKTEEIISKDKNKNKNKKSRKERQVRNKKEVIKESSEDGYSSGDDDEDDEIKNKETKTKGKNDDDDYIEEIVVPIKKKKEESIDEGNDSDEQNYIHLSDMFDSDDLKSSDEDTNDASEDDGEGDETDGVDEVDTNTEGIGCVKVIDNIDIPGHVTVKTGKPLYCLILTPTRELALQISRHLIAAAKYTGIKVATIVGGMAAVKQERVLKSGPEIVVATPGRLWELLSQGEPHLQQLPTVKFLAIDETDRMIERGHFDELQPLLERLNSDEAHKNARQNFVFSATLTLVHDLPAHMKGKKVTKRGKILNRKVEKMTPQQKIKRLINMIGMTDPKVVDITTQLGTAETLTESRIACSLDQKDVYLYYILKRHPGRTIVFCNSIGSVRRLSQLLTLLKCQPLPLHASMPQRQRLKNLERFRDDPLGVLVATDVAARGLDIPNVDHVIHYQVPKTAENYVHRSGRTARATKEGLTILMMEPAEAYSYAKLCRTLNKTSEIPSFPVSARQ